MKQDLELATSLGDVEIPLGIPDDPTAWKSIEAQQRRQALNANSSIFSEEELANLIDAVVYPRLLAYTLACIKLCACTDGQRAILLRALNAKQRDWSGLGEIPRLIGHRSIRDTLLGFLDQCHASTHAPPQRIVPQHIRKMIKLDIMSIGARTLEILYDPERKHLLLSQSGDEAQSTLDHLQALLDLPEFGVLIGSPVLSAISVLTKSSGLYPKCLDLQGVIVQGPSPRCGGSFGDVYKGDLGPRAVAVKIMRIFNFPDISKLIKSFAREGVLWRQLSHPNVLPFYGMYRVDGDGVPRLGLVSPWMDMGTMVQYLKSHPTVDRPSLLLDVASGLEYLHNFNPPVIHGDLKGVNIFMTPAGRACIADFGLCTLKYDAMVLSDPTTGANVGGTLRWQAPELLKPTNDDSQMKRPPADIYSFGCVCYEVFIGHACYSDLGIFGVITAKLANRLPSRPPADFCNNMGLDDTIWNLIKDCWRKNPADRPTASDVVQTLRLQLETRGISRPDADWDDGVAHLRSMLVEDHLSTEVFMDISDSTPTLAPSLVTCDSLTSVESAGMRLISGEDIIVAVMGPTGTGKSSFIQTATGFASVEISNTLTSGTQEVLAVSCPHPDGSGRNVIFLDTPGFDDTSRTDFDILKDIAKWLKRTYENEIKLSGILYFHSISESRMRGTPMKNLSMFRELCGDNALQNVILTTTMWDELGENSIVGATREHELRTKIWKPMMDRGCRIARFAGTRESAWQLINTFNHESRRPVKLQEELVDQGMKLNETSAYAVLISWWNIAISKLRLVLSMAKGHRTPPRQESGLELESRLKQRLDNGNRSQLSLLSEDGNSAFPTANIPRQDPVKRWTTPTLGTPPQVHSFSARAP